MGIALQLRLTAGYPKIQLGNRRVYITTGHVWEQCAAKSMILGLKYHLRDPITYALQCVLVSKYQITLKNIFIKTILRLVFFHLSLVKPLKPEEEIIPNPTQHKRVS